MTKFLKFAGCVLLTFGVVSAQAHAWQPSPGHTQVQIWPEADAQAHKTEEMKTVTDPLVAGRPLLKKHKPLKSELQTLILH